MNTLATSASTAYQSRQRAMLGPARIYFLIFGVLTIVGGVIGYVKAGSMPSIIAGSITGILLVIAAWLLPEHHAACLVAAVVISLGLAAQFVPKFIRTGKVMPAGMMSILSVIGVVIGLVAWMRK
ncbi:MAG: TMEM14 family protein [Verrucomicrobiota bacterium]|nr:TMEM14 family protein [Verrucomicrobiota bacterium]